MTMRLKRDHSEDLHDTLSLVKKDNNVYSYLPEQWAFQNTAFCSLDRGNLNRCTPYVLIELNWNIISQK